MSVVAPNQTAWLGALRRYVAAMTLGNLVWEFSHMPLYVIWDTGTLGEIVVAALHCTGGDIVIASSALVASLLLFGTDRWPAEDYRRVALSAVAIGLGYTLLSEWLNIEVRKAWAYRDLMPVIPGISAGLSPIAQWILLPTLAFWWAKRVKGN